MKLGKGGNKVSQEPSSNSANGSPEAQENDNVRGGPSQIQNIYAPDKGNEDNDSNHSPSRTLVVSNEDQDTKKTDTPTVSLPKPPTSILVNRSSTTPGGHDSDQEDPWGLDRGEAAITASLQQASIDPIPRSDPVGTGDPTVNPYGLPVQVFDAPLNPPNDNDTSSAALDAGTETQVTIIERVPEVEPVLGASFGNSLTAEQRSTPGKMEISGQTQSGNHRLNLTHLPDSNARVEARVAPSIDQSSQRISRDHREALDHLSMLIDNSSRGKEAINQGQVPLDEQLGNADHFVSVSSDIPNSPGQSRQGGTETQIAVGQGGILEPPPQFGGHLALTGGGNGGDDPHRNPSLCERCHRNPPVIGPLCAQCAEAANPDESGDRTPKCRRCLVNPALEEGLCVGCVQNASRQPSSQNAPGQISGAGTPKQIMTRGWLGPDAQGYLNHFREAVDQLRINSQGQALGTDMIRSRQVLAELRLFSHIIGLMGGRRESIRTFSSQRAIHNLLSDPDNTDSSPPIIKTLGLREAILNINRMKDTPLSDASTYHLGVVWGKIRPRPLDIHSYEVFQDDVLQSWFERVFVIRRILLDPTFIDWVNTGEILGESIKRGSLLEERIRFFRECSEAMQELHEALRFQPGIRGPAQTWNNRIGLHRVPELSLDGNLAPRIIWNMRLLSDCAHLRELGNKGWTGEGHNLHRLQAILKSTLNAFQMICGRILAPQNRDIHLAALALAQELDEGPDLHRRRTPPWANFPHPVKPWLTQSGWETMGGDLDIWMGEIHVTMEFDKRVTPPSELALPVSFREVEGGGPGKLAVKTPQRTSTSSSIFVGRGQVDLNSTYRRHESRREGWDQGTQGYVEVIREVLPGQPRARSRSEEQQAYMLGQNGNRQLGFSLNRDNSYLPRRGQQEDRRPPTRGGSGGRGRHTPRRSAGGPGGDPPWRPPGRGGDDPGDSDEDGEDVDPDGPPLGAPACSICGGTDHSQGDPSCPNAQRYCHLCLTNAHDYEHCHLRSDAPRCELCGGVAHSDPRQCPILLANEGRRAREREADTPGFPYAKWKARMELGSDLKGRYPQETDITLNSEYKNELERRRREEEKRHREESRRTQLHQENLTRTLQRASIEAAEVTRQMTSSQLAGLPDGAELPPKSKEHIEKAGTTVFLNHLGGLVRPSNNPMKDVTLEDLGFGKEVVFSGDNRGLSIKDFLKIFDEVKESRQWDDTVSAKLLSARFRGPARVWFDNLTLDPERRIDAAFYSTLKGHLLKRFLRRRDWVDKNSLFRQVRWDVSRYRGSHLSLWEDCQNAALRYMEDWDPKHTFSVKEVQDFLSSQHFFTEARDEITMYLMEKGVENDSDGIVRELQRKEEIMMSNRRRGYRPPPEPFRRASYKINAIDQTEGRSPLEIYWEEAALEENEALEVDALKKNPEGGGDEEGKLCWQCGRPGHLKMGCPELKELEKKKPKRPGDDGRFRSEEVPGYETDALRRTWTGPRATVTTRSSSGSKPRSRFTPLKREKGSRRNTPIRRDRTYKSRRTKNTYRVAALGAAFVGEDEEVIGQLDKLLVAGECANDTEEEYEDDLQPIYNPSEVAELGRTQPTPGVSDPPEVSALSLPTSLNETADSFSGAALNQGEGGERYVPFIY